MEGPCSRFTAAEGGARLASTAGSKNTLAVEYASFISTRMIYEDAYKIRGTLFDGKQRSVYITRASRVDVVAYELNILTDLKITKAVKYDDVYDWAAELDQKEVLVCTSSVIRQILEEQLLAMPNINVLVIDSSHLICREEALQYTMRLYKECEEDSRPRILGLTYPLFSYHKKETTNGSGNEEILPKSEGIGDSDLTPTDIENLPKLEEIDKNLTKTEETNITDEKLPKQEETTIITDEELPKQEEILPKQEEEATKIVETKDLLENNDNIIKKSVEIASMGVYDNLDDFEMYEKLEWKIEQLEKELCCQMDLAEDIDGGKRLSASTTKAKEVIIEHGRPPDPELLPQECRQLDGYMRSTVAEVVAFLDEHRYDPTEIYGEDLLEEFMNIPNPVIEPKHIFSQFIYVLDELGPYAADKAALSLLTKLEKLKIKVPYERHFLLLCLCTSVFIKIRCYADIVFSKYENDWKKIEAFSTPKVLRFTEILEKFCPPDQKKENFKSTEYLRQNNMKSSDFESKTSKTNELLEAIEKCDFLTLSNKIEDKVNTFEANLKDLDENYTNINKIDVNTDKSTKDFDNIVNKTETKPMAKENENNNSKNEINNLPNENNTQNDTNNTKSNLESPQKDPKNVLGFPKRQGHRTRGRGRTQRSNQARTQQVQQNPDALCGIVFMKEPLMAKIMFMLIVDMSRSHPKLSYICSQYCAVERPADPGTEPKECQRQGKKQEDVLKKFRMHECNLLLATSALEEGIDLPRCNLVLRWDVPASYRSYGLCRSRARAPRASCALLSRAGDAHTPALLHNIAVYRELDQIISRKCGCGIQDEPPQSEEDHADSLTHLVKPYTPSETKTSPNINNKLVNSDNKTETQIISNKDNKLTEISVNKTEKEIIISNKDNKLTQISDNKTETPITILNKDNKLTENSVNKTEITNNKEDNKITENSDNKSKIEIKISDNVISENENNLICNKCNIKRSCIETMCSCVGENVSVSQCKDNKKLDNKCDETVASVDLSTAIALINRYCGKLPSDTFTRLAPQWWMEEVQLPVKEGSGTNTAYICTLRLPLNCPVKHNIVGHPMPTRALARRMVALQACRILHCCGELDDQLLPIGKENFKAAELESGNADMNYPNDSARPGTTKRRQYYYKRTAWAFTDCQPVVDSTDAEIEQPTAENVQKPTTDIVKTPGTKRNMLYAIVSKLWCALPERYNTRGRRLHAPQHASQAIGILMAREEPDNLQIPAFPVYTRSGEVRVSVEYVPDADVRMTPRRGRLVRRFMRFVFAEVLRVRRRGMRLQSEGSTHNNYYIVPTVKITKEDGSTTIDVDWAFLELIYQHTEDKKTSEVERPNLWHNDDEEDDRRCSQVKEKEKKSGEVKKMENPLLKEGETFVFDAEKYREAVVTPWYRNQDQPQFFLVAEICWNLSPDSAFPSALHTTFRQYYRVKYGVSLTQTDQPLLDVDHTSNRLNLLTPRYVNRKGVALPVSSERTRRAKRDRLDQKQILVPELCRVHPFAAPLWFATVALPCVLYRINALLIADEIRRSVAIEVGLGIPKIDDSTCPGFQWPPLDFGWSLAEVLSADSEKNDKKKEDHSPKKDDKIREADDSDSQKEEEVSEEGKEKTINDILQDKECTESVFEIGTWSNEMASSIPPDDEYDEYMEPLPPNLTFCTSASGGTNWCDPIEKPKSQFQPSHKYNMADSDCSYMSSDFDTDDSDLNSDVSDEDDTSGFCSSRNSNVAMGVRIEYKTAHEAEAVDLERKKVNPAPQPDEEDDALDRRLHEEFIKSGEAPAEYINKFRQSVAEHEKDIVQNGYLIKHDEPIVEILPEPTREYHAKTRNELDKEIDIKKQIIDNKDIGDKNIEHKNETIDSNQETKEITTKADQSHTEFEVKDQLSKIDTKSTDTISQIFPYGNTDLTDENGQISLEKIEKNKRVLFAELKKSLPEDEIKKLNCFSMVDVDIDSPNYVNEKVVNLGFDKKENYKEKIDKWKNPDDYKPYFLETKSHGKEFDFDYQPNLEGHPGPSPSVILQALTMSNANDGINLERLETIGDSFLKFAITAYLYCAHPTVHEGKLSHMRSKQVSNLNLYRLGRNKRLGARMIASKFEPHDNWLPPCHRPPSTLHPRMTDKDDLPTNPEVPVDNTGCFIPYNLITQHSIPDKSIADCVEALIGAYLLECGPRGALLFMSWLGIRVLPRHDIELPADHPYVRAFEHNEANREQKPQTPPAPPRKCDSDSETDSSDDEEDSGEQQQVLAPEPDWSWRGRALGSLRPLRGADRKWRQTIFGELKAPPSPLLRYIEDPEGELEQMLSGYDELEARLQYRFKDRSLLLQALTHASHQQNRLTDCYQRLEFLGDAILDYLITRHLYEDPRRHSPGALTDLRSALVNNTIFATLAARHGFHKYFRHTSPGLGEVLARYVRVQDENGHSISEEHYLIQEDEMEQAEDVEVPKALGDLFESVAGAIFLDSGMSLGAVWRSYVSLMGAELEAFSAAAPKSPVRELLEAEPDTAKFGKPERLADGRRVRVSVEVFGRGAFKGVGRNYRIAKGTAARCALRHLKIHRQR